MSNLNHEFHLIQHPPEITKEIAASNTVGLLNMLTEVDSSQQTAVYIALLKLVHRNGFSQFANNVIESGQSDSLEQIDYDKQFEILVRFIPDKELNKAFEIVRNFLGK